MLGKTETVSFRLDSEMLDHLQKTANITGVSKGEMAKRFVIRSLAEIHTETIKELLLEVRHDLRLLRKEHITSTNALLIGAGKVTREQAQEFIENKLLRKT